MLYQTGAALPFMNRTNQLKISPVRCGFAVHAVLSLREPLSMMDVLGIIDNI